MRKIILSSLVLFIVAALHGQILRGVPGELTFDSRLELQNPLITVGDVNGDGFDDIITATAPTFLSVSVYFGNGTGYFTPGPTSPTNCIVCAPGYGFLANFNGDGRPDLIGFAGGDVFIMLGNGDGTFQPATLYTGNGSVLGATDLAVADLNGDGKPDFVAANPGGSTFSSTTGMGPSASPQLISATKRINSRRQESAM